MAAAIDAVLDTSSGELGLRTDDGRFQIVLWPYGWSAIAGPPVALLDSAGRQLAKVGDHVRATGGQTSEGIWLACIDGFRLVSSN